MSFENSGRDARREWRNENFQQQRASAKFTFTKWVREEGDSLRKEGQAYDKASFAREMANYKTKINDGEFRPLERHWLRKFLYSHSLDRLSQYKLPSSPVHPPVSVTRSASRRTIGNLHRSRKLEKWDKVFQERLVKVSQSSSNSGQIWLGLALWSAISRSQLCEPELIKALRDRLLEDETILQQGIDDRLCIRLLVGNVGEDAKGDDWSISRGNQRTGETLQRVHYFHPDALTLSLIWRWLRSDRQIPERQKVIVTIRDALFPARDATPNYKELDNLCRHAIWLADLRPGPASSEALCEIASGGWAGLGLDDHAHSLCTSERPESKPLKKPAACNSSRHSPFKLGSANWPVLQRLQVIFQKDGRRWPSRADILLELIPALDLASRNSAEYLLVAWFIHLLEQNKLKVSSVATYHSRISARLIDGFAGCPIDNLEASDFELLYHSIIDRIDLPITRAQVAGRLDQLHRFGVRNKRFALPALVESLGSGTGPMMVRSRTIPNKSLQALLNSIAFVYENDRLTLKQLRVAVLLGWRAGLRLGEVTKLRLRDVEPSNDRWLFILPNRYGPNKTLSARRQIRLAPLLTKEELDEFTAFMATRRRAHPDHPVFVDPETGDALDDIWLSRTVSGMMNDTFGGTDWTFHHLRHSAANNLFLALERENELCKKFSGWDKAQQEMVCKAVQADITARQKRYLALATFIGHASPQETFESYIHLVEPVLAARRSRQPIVDELDIYSAALGQTASRTKRYESDADIHAVLRRRLARWTIKHKIRKLKDKAISALADTRNLPTKNRHALRQCRVALSALEEGATIGEAAIEASIDEVFVQKWLAAAEALGKLKTKYGKSRLFSSGRIDRTKAGRNAGRKLLLPTEPKSRLEKTDCEAMIAHFRDLWMNVESREDAAWGVEYVINNVDSGNSGIPFTESNDALRFLELFAGSVFAMDRWHLDLRRVAAPQLPAWKNVEAWKIAKQKGMTTRSQENAKKGRAQNVKSTKRGPKPKGHARLHLQHPKWERVEGRGGEVKYTAPTLRYVMHMLSIMTAT